MRQPRIKRYALVPDRSAPDGVRSFHLARVASGTSRLRADRLERMEEIAARERARDNGRPG